MINLLKSCTKLIEGGGAVQKLFTRTDPVHLYIYCAYLGVCLFVFCIQ